MIEEQTWMDETYGSKGFKVWIVFISWIGLIYILFFLFVDITPSSLVEEEPILPLEIYLMLMLIYIGLFLGGGLFIFQCKRTVYRIDSTDMINFNVHLYLWGKLQFTCNDVKSIDVHCLKGIRKYITPFELNCKNYRINLINGDCFYVAGSFKNISSFLETLHPSGRTKLSD